MITKSQPAHTLLPGFMLAACVALPGGAAAQTPPPTTGTGALSTAMAEARRSPFYASGGGDALTILGPVGVLAPHVGYQSAPDSANRPSFHRVFWPTLGAVFLSEIAFIYTILYCDPDSGGGGRGCTDAEWGSHLLLGFSTLVLGPPAAARIAGGSFTRGVLGSLAGTALGYGFFRLGMGFGLDDSVAYWAIPTTHAFLTAAFSSRL